MKYQYFPKNYNQGPIQTPSEPVHQSLTSVRYLAETITFSKLTPEPPRALVTPFPSDPFGGGEPLGVWRSLVARFVRDEEVAGSNPVTPTTALRPLTLSGFFVRKVPLETRRGAWTLVKFNRRINHTHSSF